MAISEFVWDDLKYFLLVTSAGSVAAAARVAKVEHSTMTRRITRLERTLNVRLFDRLVRGWVLTEEGRALQEKAILIEANMLAVKRFALTFGRTAGRVTLTAPPDFLSEVLSRALGGFRKAYPEIELSLLGEMREANLSRGEADIALRMAEVEGAELVTQRICDVRYQFYGLAELKDTAPKNRAFIGYSTSHQPDLNNVLLRQAADRPIVLQTNTLRVALQASLNGEGIALLPAFLAAKSPELQVIEETVEPITRPVYLVMQRDVRNAERVRAVVDYIKSNISKAVGVNREA